MANTYNKRVWAGDPTTVAEARAKYNDNPGGELINFAGGLYSFRTNRRYVDELVELRGALMGRAELLLKEWPRADSYKDLTDEADCLSTYLEWISRHKEGVYPQERIRLRERAKRLCEEGIALIASFELQHREGDHTLSLLKLTLARIYLTMKEPGQASRLLNEVRGAASEIVDPKQRARVYAKLGFLYRKSATYNPALFFIGLRWGIQACFVWGITPFGRVKCAAALVGIDR